MRRSPTRPRLGLPTLHSALSGSPAPLEYPGHYEVRLVSRNGGIRWQEHWVNVSQTPGEEYVGLVAVDDGNGTSTSARSAWADPMSAPA